MIETFIAAYHRGAARVEDIHGWVASWHRDPKINGDISLYDFLGMTWDEYSRWVQDPKCLRAILKAHKPAPSVVSDTEIVRMLRNDSHSPVLQLIRVAIHKYASLHTPKKDATFAAALMLLLGGYKVKRAHWKTGTYLYVTTSGQVYMQRGIERTFVINLDAMAKHHDWEVTYASVSEAVTREDSAPQEAPKSAMQLGQEIHTIIEENTRLKTQLLQITQIVDSLRDPLANTRL